VIRFPPVRVYPPKFFKANLEAVDFKNVNYFGVDNVEDRFSHGFSKSRYKKVAGFVLRQGSVTPEAL
jgi:hypothetical protein